MAKIAFYSDSFGWGHATRDIAFMREWASWRPRDEIYWRVGAAIGGICAKMAGGHGNIYVREIEGGISFCPRGAGIDVEKSRGRVLEWFARRRAVEMEEGEFLKKNGVDLVFSDIRPEAFNAAEEAGLPCFAISNFSWSLICKKNWEELEELHEYLEGAYSLADISFILPLNEPCTQMARRVKSPFLARGISRKIGKNGGTGGKRAIVSFGKSAGEEKIKMPEGVDAFGFPEGDTESQDYIPLADFVVSKASYGICSEAVQAGVPCILSAREGFEESKYVLRQMVENGWGVKMEGSVNFRLLDAKREWKGADFGFFEFARERLEQYLKG